MARRARASGLVRRGHRPAVPGGRSCALRRAGRVPPREVPRGARRGARGAAATRAPWPRTCTAARCAPQAARSSAPTTWWWPRTCPSSTAGSTSRAATQSARTSWPAGPRDAPAWHVPLHRAARALDQSARRLAARGRREPQDRTGRRRGALRTPRGVGAGALRRSSPVLRWATQDHMPADGVPYVGRHDPLSSGVWVATGFRKWGLAMGTAAAELLAAQIAGPRPRLGGAVRPAAAAAEGVRRTRSSRRTRTWRCASSATVW